MSADKRTVKILAWTVAARKPVKPGMILSLPAVEAQLLVGIKKAEYVDTATQEEADELVNSGEAEIPSDAVVVDVQLGEEVPTGEAPAPAPVEQDAPVFEDAEAPAPAPEEVIEEKKPKPKGKKNK